MVCFLIFVLLCRTGCWEGMGLCIGIKELSGNKWFATTSPAILSFYIIGYFLNDTHVCKWNSSTKKLMFSHVPHHFQHKRMTKGFLWNEKNVDWGLDSNVELTLLYEEAGLNVACDWVLTPPVTQLGWYSRYVWQRWLSPRYWGNVN